MKNHFILRPAKKKKSDSFRLTYFFKKPPVCANPQNYLNENKYKLKFEIEDSVGFNQTRDQILKCWITCWSYYVKIDAGVSGGVLNLRKAFNEGLVQNTVIHTVAYRLGFNSGTLSVAKLSDIIKLVGDGFVENEDTMSQSGWSYYKSVDFRICFATVGYTRLCEISNWFSRPLRRD